MFRRKSQESTSLPTRTEWTPSQRKVRYPRWTCVYVPEVDEYSLIWDKTRLVFLSERAFRTWGKIPLIASTESVSGYPVWKRLGYAAGTVIESVVDNTKYYITGKLFEEEKLLIATPDFYEVLGFNPNLAVKASLEEVNFHKEGGIISDIRHL